MERARTLLRLQGMTKGVFLDRVNRFLVRIRTDGKPDTALLRNTGRLEELRPGTEILCVPKRGGKTSSVLVAFVAGGIATLIDPFIQSRSFEIAAAEGLLPWLGEWVISRKEVRVGRSRIDYLIEGQSRTGYLETKSAARLVGSSATYPDCPTDRGVRHIRLLGELARRKRRCVILFVATHPDADCFEPDWVSDPRVGAALLKARADGAEVRCIKLVLRDESVSLGEPSLPVSLRKPAATSLPR